MNKSESIKQISGAILAAQKTMGDVTKGNKSSFYKDHSYADLNAIREVVIPALNTQGVSVLQPTTSTDGRNYVETVLLHESGEWISGTTEIKNTKGDAQGEGSGISYARRYGLQSLLSVGAVDDDGEAAQGRVNEKKESNSSAVSSKPNSQTGGIRTPVPNVGTSNTTVEIVKSNTKDLIGAAFKTLEAQKKVTAQSFKETSLKGKSLSKLTDKESEEVLTTIKTNYPELGL